MGAMRNGGNDEAVDAANIALGAAERGRTTDAGDDAADGSIADGQGGWDEPSQLPADDFADTIENSDAMAAATADLWDDLD